jgi:diguanylate cyclase (GGDEF)-like protein/PAS domain S-box-containing protein
MSTNISRTASRDISAADQASMIDHVIRSSPDLSTVMTPDGNYVWVASSSKGLFGWNPNDMRGKSQEDLAHPDDALLLHDSRLAAMSGKGPMIVPYRFVCGDGRYRWVEAMCVRIESEESPLIVCTLRDIEHRKASEFILQQQAFTDPLTGIANRTVFLDRLGHALKRLERRKGIVSVLFLDLDRFKVINDSMGHRAGDKMLLALAERLHRIVRPADTLARLGGDEFAIIVEDISSPDVAVNLGNRIIKEGREPFKVGEEEFVCTISVGVAETSDPRHSAEDLLKEADLALYRAKDRGRDRAEMFDEDLKVRAAGRLGTERMLRRAIAEDRLLLEFQPVIDLRTGRTVAVESLIRVWDPEKGPLPAETFIDVAEESGLLPTMDTWVLSKALEQASSWRETFSGTDFDDVAINVTARHLADADFAQAVIDALNEHGLPADSLQIEITERVLVEASNSAMSGLRLLRTAGVKVGLDDFGTGYSSLSALRHLPLDFVKIDRSFIHQLDKGAAEEAIVASIISLCHALQMAVVAEGIESPEELEILTSLGCDRGQGFLFAPSGDPASIELLVLQDGSG